MSDKRKSLNQLFYKHFGTQRERDILKQLKAIPRAWFVIPELAGSYWYVIIDDEIIFGDEKDESYFEVEIYFYENQRFSIEQFQSLLRKQIKKLENFLVAGAL